MALRRRVLILTILFTCIFFASQAQIAKDKCKFLGNITSTSTPSDFAELWNQVTPENGGKWGTVEASKDVMNWSQLDIAYQTAKDNGFPFKQHAFVWGQQQPAWIGTLPPEEQRQQVEQWIRLFCERYPDTDFIDVVNEPLHAVPNYSGALGGSGTTNWDWVVWAFEKAREYCPNAKLLLNDYNIINNNVATLNYLDIINILKARNLIDVIGEQGHFLETTSNLTISANLDKFAATGLPIHITEYDVNLANDTEQKNRYETQFRVLWGHTAVQGITLWGYRQGEIWQTNAYVKRSNGTDRPALTWLKTYVAANSGGSFCLTVGVNDHDESVDVYPNPASGGRFAIEAPGHTEGAIVHIRDIQGRLVHSQTLITDHVDLDLQVSPGMYIIEVTDGQRRVIGKLLITE
jgi:endo-1,4-beta-xylanase